MAEQSRPIEDLVGTLGLEQCEISRGSPACPGGNRTPCNLLVIICEWGCGYFSAIDCSTVEGEVVNLLDDLERKVMGCTFAQWMEVWVNGVDLWTRDLKWTPLSRPFFAPNKLMPGGVLGLSFGGGYGSPPPAIPALESALGSHPCGTLSSVQVPSL
jgi:hypothetical protein